MNLSTIFNFAFICIPKTGSTSISEAVRPYCTINYEHKPSLKHMTSATLHQHILPFHRNLFPDVNIETFCVMREPLDWLHSWYRFRSRPEISEPSHIRFNNYCGHLSFNEFIDAVISEKPPSFADIGNQSRYMYLDDGSIGIDKIFRWQYGLKEVFDHLEKKINIALSVPIKNVSPKQELNISASLLDEIHKHYAQDFELYESVNSNN